jgi:2-polyprenyl-3-methyl-5-hydroxy-6-metoxy-1,4-benzoquinol methylase
MQDYQDKTEGYFSVARYEVEPLLPARAERVLEIGCGAGLTMQWLRQTGRAGEAWGIELVESAAQRAREHFREVRVGDAEALAASAFDGLQFDLILCLDVLEHMVDPWRCVQALEQRLAPGGRLVISVPNVRCLKVVLPLLFLGEWRYGEKGILDRTHLRFFTRRTALALAAGNGLRIDRCIGHRQAHSRLALLHRATFGRLVELTSIQFIVAASRPG